MSHPSPTLPTRVAHAGWNEHRFFGHRLFAELAGHESLTGMMAMAVTGRRLPPEACAVLDDIAVVICVADPRIWPLKLTRVASAYGHVLPGITVGNLVMQGALIGFWPAGRAAKHLLDLRSMVADCIHDVATVREAVLCLLERERTLAGFGVPFRPQDERMVALRDCMTRRGRQSLPYWSLMETASKVMVQERGVPPNICMGIAAACLDLGISPHEIATLTAIFTNVAFVANAVEGATQAPEALRSIPQQFVRYAGAPPRLSPRARGEE